MTMTTHNLKTWPEFYQVVYDGNKAFEIRVNDRDFQVGDEVVLEEWDPKTKDYTGRKTHVIITYLIEGPRFGIKAGYVVFAFKRKEKTEKELQGLGTGKPKCIFTKYKHLDCTNIDVYETGDCGSVCGGPEEE